MAGKFYDINWIKPYGYINHNKSEYKTINCYKFSYNLEN